MLHCGPWKGQKGFEKYFLNKNILTFPLTQPTSFLPFACPFVMDESWGMGGKQCWTKARLGHLPRHFFSTQDRSVLAPVANSVCQSLWREANMTFSNVVLWDWRPVSEVLKASAVTLGHEKDHHNST
jgi:hypothetical protein